MSTTGNCFNNTLFSNFPPISPKAYTCGHYANYGYGHQGRYNGRIAKSEGKAQIRTSSFCFLRIRGFRTTGEPMTQFGSSASLNGTETGVCCCISPFSLLNFPISVSAMPLPEPHGGGGEFDVSTWHSSPPSSAQFPTGFPLLSSEVILGSSAFRVFVLC